VHAPCGRLGARVFDPASTPLTVHFLPAQKCNVERFGFEPSDLGSLLKSLDPDYVWIHAEFWDGIAGQLLARCRFHRRPRLVAYAALNHFGGRTPLLRARWPFLSRTRMRQIALWSRLDGVCACAAKSMVCARRMGLPQSVPVSVNFLPVFGPEDASTNSVALPWRDQNMFVVGFAGNLTEQKGWKVLLEAIERLPERFKAVIIGDGEQRPDVESCLKRPKLADRVVYAGVLPKSDLLATYPLFDAFALPSVTTAHAVEQFGCVLAEAMACGVPVIGSDSGAIPEVIGDAGLVVPEGDAEALARAIERLSEDEELRARLVALGRQKHRTQYSCVAYARSLEKALLGPAISKAAEGALCSRVGGLSR
jgi:glycosyltransferase involved in cell wall biosynthesis